MKKFFNCFLIVVVSLFITSNVDATSLVQYEKNVSETLMSSSGISTGQQIYNFPTATYDFFDENNLFNSVYTSKKKIYWTKYDDKMQEKETIVIDKYYLPNFSERDKFLEDLAPTFGNAIYYKGHLFVVYGRAANGSKTENLNDLVMAVVKYDKNGQIVDKLEMEAKYLTDNLYTASSGATFLPFFENGNCSLAINSDDVLAIMFGHHRFDDHQSVVLTAVNTNNLEWVSNPDVGSYENRLKYYTMSTYFNSHSFGQRVVATSDGGFITVDQGDATYRGINVNKYSLNSNGALTSKRKIMVHFREGLPGDIGGNNYIFSVLGNIIELNDGFMYVGAIENTLSQDFGNTNNESRNLFIQKYSKDMNDKTIEEAQMLEAPQRVVTGEKPSDPSIGKLYLRGNEVDYGMKFLTDLQNKTSITNLKAIKIENDEIVILFEENVMKEYWSGGTYYGYNVDEYDKKAYYMIIDSAGNIVKDKEEVKNIDLTTEEIYAYKNGQIYWTTTDNYTATVNVLTIKEIPITDVSFSTKDVYISKNSKATLKVNINPENTNMDRTLHFESNNPSVATVNDEGVVTAISNGEAKITVKTSNGLTAECTVTVRDYLKGDLNKNDVIDMPDVYIALKIALNHINPTDEQIQIGDINNTGSVDMADTYYILKTALNIG